MRIKVSSKKILKKSGKSVETEVGRILNKIEK